VLAKVHVKLVKRLRTSVYLVKLNLTKLHLMENVYVRKNSGTMVFIVCPVIIAAEHAINQEHQNVNLVMQIKIENIKM